MRLVNEPTIAPASSRKCLPRAPGAEVVDGAGGVAATRQSSSATATSPILAIGPDYAEAMDRPFGNIIALQALMGMPGVPTSHLSPEPNNRKETHASQEL